MLMLSSPRSTVRARRGPPLLSRRPPRWPHTKAAKKKKKMGPRHQSGRRAPPRIGPRGRPTSSPAKERTASSEGDMSKRRPGADLGQRHRRRQGRRQDRRRRRWLRPRLARQRRRTRRHGQGPGHQRRRRHRASAGRVGGGSTRQRAASRSPSKKCFDELVAHVRRRARQDPVRLHGRSGALRHDCSGSRQGHAGALTINETGRTVKGAAHGFASEVDECIGGQMDSWRFPVPKD